MKIDKHNLRNMAVGEVLWVVPGAFSYPYKVTCIGRHDGKQMFVNSSEKLESIDLAKPTTNKAFRDGRLARTHDEALEILRELCIEEIEHFNGRSLKKNPIKFEP